MKTARKGRPATGGVKSAPLCIRVDQALMAELRSLAKADQRSVASMAAILMREAIAARRV